MPASKVNSLGTVAVTGGATTVVITTTAGVAVNDEAFMSISVRQETGLTVNSCADTRGNTWVKELDALSGDSASHVHIALFRSRITTAIQVGDTITVTLSGASSRRSGVAMSVGGIRSPSPLDKTATATLTSTTAADSGLTANTAEAGEFAIGLCGSFDNNIDTPVTPGSGWTVEAAVGVAQANAAVTCALMYRSLTSIGQFKADLTWNETANQSTAGIATYFTVSNTKFVPWIGDIE